MNLGTWAKYVKQRDGYACTECGATRNIDSHHIVKEIDGGTRTLDNGISLCKKCHKKIHGYGVNSDSDSTLTVRVNSKQKNALESLCSERGMSVGTMLRKRISEYLDTA